MGNDFILDIGNKNESKTKEIKADRINLSSTKLLSHSAIQILRACPRKFELNRLLPERREEATIHTAFGSAMGAGIQKIIETGSLEEATLEAFKFWNIALSEEDNKSYKSFPHVILGLKKFYTDALPHFGPWKLAYLKNNRPACELSFAVKLPRGYWYRGFIDAVLQNEETKQYRVLELKTTASKFTNEVSYANSFQGVSYSIILDAIAPEGYSDYEVLYLVYKTFSQLFEYYPFIKTPQHRMNWISDLVLTFQQIEMYKRSKRFSQNGDACRAYNRICPFYEMCNYSNDSIFHGVDTYYNDEEIIDTSEFDFVFTLDELLTNQSHKGNIE